jgi:hypothetical protein
MKATSIVCRSQSETEQQWNEATWKTYYNITFYIGLKQLDGWIYVFSVTFGNIKAIL